MSVACVLARSKRLCGAAASPGDVSSAAAMPAIAASPISLDNALLTACPPASMKQHNIRHRIAASARRPAPPPTQIEVRRAGPVNEIERGVDGGERFLVECG